MCSCECVSVCVWMERGDGLCWLPASSENYRLFVRIMLLVDWRSV